MKTSKLNPYSFPVSRLANRGRFKKKFYKNWQGHKPEKLVTFPCALWALSEISEVHFYFFFQKVKRCIKIAEIFPNPICRKTQMERSPQDVYTRPRKYNDCRL